MSSWRQVCCLWPLPAGRRPRWNLPPERPTCRGRASPAMCPWLRPRKLPCLYQGPCGVAVKTVALGAVPPGISVLVGHGRAETPARWRPPPLRR
eukprot:772274-Pyramimonas_sp.AAC.1